MNLPQVRKGKGAKTAIIQGSFGFPYQIGRKGNPEKGGRRGKGEG